MVPLESVTLEDENSGSGSVSGLTGTGIGKPRLEDGMGEDLPGEGRAEQRGGGDCGYGRMTRFSGVVGFWRPSLIAPCHRCPCKGTLSSWWFLWGCGGTASDVLFDCVIVGNDGLGSFDIQVICFDWYRGPC